MKLSITMLAWLVSLSVVIATLLTPVQLVIYAVTILTIAYLNFRKFYPADTWAKRRWLPWAGLPLIVLLSVGYGQYRLSESLSSRLALNQDKLQVEMSIIPERIEHHVSGLRITAKVMDPPDDISQLKRVKLSWYSDRKVTKESVFVVGCTVKVTAVLRAPRRFANPLLFDYEAYNLINGIDAIGYVRNVVMNSVSSARHCGGITVTEVRSAVVDARLNSLSTEARPWVSGLVFAEKNAFSAEKWQLAQATGTLHLLVVSGLHLGIISVLALLVAGVFRRLLVVVTSGSVLANRAISMSVIVLTTGLYAGLAGFGISLFRSWLMLLLFWFLWMSLRRFSWTVILSLVLMSAVLVNPLIYTQLGFQLSFLAVAVLLTVFSGQRSSRIRAAALPQILIFIALMPLMLSWSMPVSLGQIVINVMAIPYVGLILLPLSLANAVFDIEWLQPLLIVAGEGYWYVLEQSQNWNVLNVGLSIESRLQLLMLSVLILLWLQSLTVPMNLLVPVAVVTALALAASDRAELRMLDVGQGLSIVVHDGDKALVVDAGARYRGGFDLGEKVVAPYLRSKGVRRLQLVVSHSENDHAGGMPALIQQFDVDAIYQGQTGHLDGMSSADRLLACRRDNGWRVMSSKVRYRFFAYQLAGANDNNQSCVVMVWFAGLRVLIPGDIEVAAEKELVGLYGSELRADILVAPHHGSGTSSSGKLLSAVKPEQVWISSGFNNRFGHPHPSVVTRYREAGIRILSTAERGSVALNTNGRVSYSRQGWQRPWVYPSEQKIIPPVLVSDLK